MKKGKLVLLFLVLTASSLFAEEAPVDPVRLFSAGNAFYEKGEYDKAAEEYKKILDSGIESGNLYYDLGNTFFKMGKTGYAILSYKRAQEIMPGDSDLKSNLVYVQSLTEDSALSAQPPNKFIWLIKFPFREFNLNTVAIILLSSYLVLILFLIGGIASHVFRRRITILFYLVLLLFLAALACFSVRYYQEEVLAHGIVVAKEAECKYEPIDKSTTYYTLREGQEVLILDTRNGWRRIKRLDGKLAWLKKEAVEEI